jgi:nucleoside-diphosphate-sugar epimerase
MKVLVTGHLGYVGTVMVPALRAAGHDVTGYDSDLYRRCTYDAGGAIVDVPAITKDTRDAARRSCQFRRGDPSCGAFQ